MEAAGAAEAATDHQQSIEQGAEETNNENVALEHVEAQENLPKEDIQPSPKDDSSELAPEDDTQPAPGDPNNEASPIKFPETSQFSFPLEASFEELRPGLFAVDNINVGQAKISVGDKVRVND